MTARTRLRAAVATTVGATALAFVAGITGAAPASADNLCYSASVSGSITGPHSVPRECFLTSFPAACVYPASGVGAFLTFAAEACAPD